MIELPVVDLCTVIQPKIYDLFEMRCTKYSDFIKEHELYNQANSIFYASQENSLLCPEITVLKKGLRFRWVENNAYLTATIFAHESIVHYTIGNQYHFKQHISNSNEESIRQFFIELLIDFERFKNGL